MYHQGSGSVAYGGAPQAGWYGNTYTGYQGAQGGWQGQQPAGYPTQQYQAQQVQQPYQQRYQQPYGQQVYQQLPESQQRHVQHQSSRPARAEAPAPGPQDGARGGMRASTPNNRPSKRARADHARTAETQQQIPRQRYDPQQDLLGAGATAPWLDALSADIIRFAQQAQPSRHEEQQRQAALTELQRVVDYSLGQTHRGITATLFGSGRAGLALHSSDLDIMINGKLDDSKHPNKAGGYPRPLLAAYTWLQQTRELQKACMPIVLEMDACCFQTMHNSNFKHKHNACCVCWCAQVCVSHRVLVAGTTRLASKWLPAT